MINWWTEDDKNKFDAKTQKLVDQYNSFEALDGVFVNGKLTLGENIADLGGLTIAYHAFVKSLEGKEKKTINGYTPEQRFFIAFAHVWKNTIRDNALEARIKSDSHSPGKYRVNGTLANMPEFFAAFAIKKGAPMRQDPNKIAKIW
jgi:putative endopeptidase